MIGDWANLGVGVAALVALVVVVKTVLGFIGNDLEHHTKATIELREAVKELIGWLKKNGR